VYSDFGTCSFLFWLGSPDGRLLLWIKWKEKWVESSEGNQLSTVLISPVLGSSTFPNFHFWPNNKEHQSCRKEVHVTASAESRGFHNVKDFLHYCLKTKLTRWTDERTISTNTGVKMPAVMHSTTSNMSCVTSCHVCQVYEPSRQWQGSLRRENF
jgi:hypothetical protein